MDQSHAVFLSPTNSKHTPVHLEFLKIKPVPKEPITMFSFTVGESLTKKSTGLEEIHGDQLGEPMELSKLSKVTITWVFKHFAIGALSLILGPMMLEIERFPHNLVKLILYQRKLVTLFPLS